MVTPYTIGGDQVATGNQAVAKAARAIVALLRDMGEGQAVVSITFKGDQPQIVITGIGVTDE